MPWKHIVVDKLASTYKIVNVRNVSLDGSFNFIRKLMFIVGSLFNIDYWLTLYSLEFCVRKHGRTFLLKDALLVTDEAERVQSPNKDRRRVSLDLNKKFVENFSFLMHSTPIF